MSKKAVIVLGAGAPIAWGAPSTFGITQELLEDKEFLIKGNSVNLAKYIRDQLAAFHGRDSAEINFEHIINTLEALTEYLSQEISRGGPPQYTGSKPLWFAFTQIFDQLENYRFDLLNNGTNTGVLFNLAKAGDTPYQVEKDQHKRSYFYRVVNHYLDIIRSSVARYDQRSALEGYKKENEGLVSFYEELKRQGYTVRVYTTNYDSLLPNIFDIKGGTLYNGFDAHPSGGHFPNISKILTTDELDCYYNLHGSIYWELGLKRNPDTNWENSFSYTGQVAVMNNHYAEYTNPAEKTTIYNITTGFNKLQKISIEPLRAFFTSLSMDCIKADIVATVGYSYGDAHVNRSLGYAVREKHAKFLHLTYSDMFWGSPEYINMQKHTMNKNRHQNFIPTTSGFEAKDKTAYIFTKGFQSFLFNREWEILKGWL